jgi:cobalt transporter subunit CbtA
LPLIRRVLVAALVSGLIAGLCAFVLHSTKTTPLILAAEVYEAAGDHATEVGEWKPQAGWERLAYTAAADTITGIGFALLLAGAITLRGRPVDPGAGVLWGAAGFVTFSLAPAFGLPPELPGSIGADLAARQGWWLGTVLATAAGLSVLAFGRGGLVKACGGGILALPHLLGAPHPQGFGSTAPAELAAAFASVSLGIAAVFWAVLGAAIGWMFERLESQRN